MNSFVRILCKILCSNTFDTNGWATVGLQLSNATSVCFLSVQPKNVILHVNLSTFTKQTAQTFQIELTPSFEDCPFQNKQICCWRKSRF